jgi:hypothetical protein
LAVVAVIVAVTKNVAETVAVIVAGGIAVK